jgi:hypothetical protein
MPVTSHIFAKGPLSMGQKKVDLSTDTLRMVLLSAFTPGSLNDTAQVVGDVFASGTEATAGGGYTAGGLSLTGVTFATTAANSWATSAATSTAYDAGRIVRPASANGFLYQAVTTGTTAGSVPTYPTTVGGTVVDGSVTWLNIGKAVTVLGSSTVSWTASGTIAAAYAVLIDFTALNTTPGWVASGTNPVIGWWDLGGTQTASGGGTFQITQTTSGLLAIPAS